MWYMAVITRGISVMAGFLPAVELVPHDVAVDAGIRISGEVGGAMRKIERVPAGTQQYPDHQSKQQPY